MTKENGKKRCQHQWQTPEVGDDGIVCSRCGRFMHFINDFAAEPYKAHSIIKAVMNRLMKEEAEEFVDSFGRAYEDARTRFEKEDKSSYPHISVAKYQEEFAKRIAKRTGFLDRLEQWVAAMKREDLAEAYRIAYQPIPSDWPKYEQGGVNAMQTISRAVGTSGPGSRGGSDD